MGRIVITEFVSLDGVMQAPGGEEFKYPGWSFEFDRGDDGNQFKLDEAMEADGERFCVAVQWHPEMETDDRRLLAALVERARARRDASETPRPPDLPKEHA